MHPPIYHYTIVGFAGRNGGELDELGALVRDARKYPVLIERIGYWETALEIDDPEILLDAAVTSALNSFHDVMRDNPLAADPQKFVATITQAAREWAEECFNTEQ